MTSTIFNNYGDFFKSKIFEYLFIEKSRFEKNQKRAAQEIVDQVFRHCFETKGCRDFPGINTIIDLGCGDGQLLASIKNELKPLEESITYYGFDTCQEMINSAKTTYNSVSELNFFSIDNISAVFDHAAFINNWSKTALVCLGHTWFHILDQEELLCKIGEKRPALILIDVFQTWDDVVADLKDKNYVDEETRALKFKVKASDKNLCETTSDNCIYSLRTEKMNYTKGELQKVHRGIHVTPPGSEPAYWLFRTTQVLKSTEDLRPTHHTLNSYDASAEASEKIKAIKDLGDITGTNNYLFLREFEHVSGWGNMRCLVFGALSPVGKILNDEYFSVVSDLVRSKISIKNSADTASEVKNLKSLLKIFGDGEIAVIMPFDPLRTFLRMVPLDQEKQEIYDPITEIDLIVEEPNKYQQRFPTAYSLYHSMLHLVSSPIGFPLNRVPGYKKALVDELYEKLESEFLANKTSKKPKAPPPTTAQGDQNEPQSTEPTTKPSCKDDEDKSYFLIPFYFGCLPVFSLILQEPQHLPVGSTQAQVFYAFAQNLDRQLHVVFNEEEIHSSLIAPFLQKVWIELCKKQSIESTIPTEINKNEIKRLFEIALEKPWKSWTQALPSHNIKTLDSVSQQDKQLRTKFNFELTRVAGDAFTNISYWFQTQDFFGVDKHDKFVCHLHGPCLKNLIILLNDENSDLYTSSYFSSVEKNPKNESIFRFTTKLIKLINDCTSDTENKCNNYKKECKEASHNPCDHYTNIKSPVFLATKRLFCRDLANTNNTFRFTFLRIAAAVLAFAESDPSQHTNDFNTIYIFDETIDAKLVGNLSSSTECEKVIDSIHKFIFFIKPINIKKIEFIPYKCNKYGHCKLTSTITTESALSSDKAPGLDSKFISDLVSSHGKSLAHFYEKNLFHISVSANPSADSKIIISLEIDCE